MRDKVQHALKIDAALKSLRADENPELAREVDAIRADFVSFVRTHVTMTLYQVKMLDDAYFGEIDDESDMDDDESDDGDPPPVPAPA